MTVTLRQIEIHPTSDCTLRCHGCQHGSHLLQPWYYTPAAFVPHLQKLREVASWSSLIIAGGEPFLSPHAADIIQSCHAVQPCHTIIITNGYWLLQPSWFFHAVPILKHCHHLVVSRYPPYVNQLGSKEWQTRIDILKAETGITASTFHPDNPEHLTFTTHQHHDTPQPLTTDCALSPCIQLLPNGFLARCPLGYWLQQIPGVTSAFRESYARTGFYNIQDPHTPLEFWNQSPRFDACHFCGLATGHYTVEPWRRECDDVIRVGRNAIPSPTVCDAATRSV